MVSVEGKAMQTVRTVEEAPTVAEFCGEIWEAEKKIERHQVSAYDLKLYPNGMLKIQAIDPCMVWLGHDSRRSHLPEPPLEKVRILYWELPTSGFTVVLETIRKAWWKESELSARPAAARDHVHRAGAGGRPSVAANQG